LAELIVDEKHRVMLPRDMRERLGIASGSKLEVEQRGDEIIIRPAVPTKNPTQAIWGARINCERAEPEKACAQGNSQEEEPWKVIVLGSLRPASSSPS